ncbi:uncharacterized protein LOC125468672 [Pyrus x bretschneideri]|uniref:uncharacterized protein LOC125468672 n=1 Tax=Pyrus x bretschneideri TaxID=225117 RepID=UPI00202FF135|nr:uncharacterized protein LOC125468672 [Pyrus x bretschneideri]
MSRKASRIMVLYIASDNHSSARQRLEWPRADLFGSHDSNSLEDILRKGFSTGAPMQELLLSRFLMKLKNYPKLKPCLESSFHLVVEISLSWFPIGLVYSCTTIITTRDMQLLNGVDAVIVSKPKNLSESEALELFKQHAFRTNQPTRDYDCLSRLAIQHAHGVPLALKILGACHTIS